MKYNAIKQAVFIDRPNRFIAHCMVDEAILVCHVKNTGRCKELLVPGARVVLEQSQNPNRKTLYDLVAVYKGDVLFNIDSQAPNKVVAEWLEGFDEIQSIKAECTYAGSRFDFCVDTIDKKVFLEVKGVTLERDGRLLFPDAPTERGQKHLKELAQARQQGYGAGVIFVVQADIDGVFYPNEATDPDFAKALREARARGVEVICLNCIVEEQSLAIKGFIASDI